MMVGATDRGLCFVQFADSDSELLELLGREYPLADIAPMGATYPDHFSGVDGSAGEPFEGLPTSPELANGRTRDCLPDEGLALPAIDSIRYRAVLFGCCSWHRSTLSRQSCGSRLRRKSPGLGHSLSPSHSRHGRARRIQMGD